MKQMFPMLNRNMASERILVFISDNFHVAEFFLVETVNRNMLLQDIFIGL
jgi:hypothetical protein